MDQHTHYESGQRVATPRAIIGHKTIPVGWEGTVQYEKNNGVGRILVYVLWDLNGEIWPVFPEDLAHI